MGKGDRSRPELVLGVVLVVLFMLGGALAACGSDPRRPIAPEFDLRHPSASRRLEAIAVTASSGDASHVPVLFDLLDDGDDAVRLAAAAALRQKVGRGAAQDDGGYVAYAPREERVVAAKRWRASWQGAASPAPTSPRDRPAEYTGSPGVPAR